MENFYKPIDSVYSARVRFLHKIVINSVYGMIKTPMFWISEEFIRREEIKKKRELRIEKLNKLNTL